MITATLLGTPSAQAAKKKPAARKPQMVVVVSEHSPECTHLKQRLSSEQDLLPLARHFNVTYVEVDNDPQRNMFVNQFGVRGLITPPTLGFAGPDGTPVKVVPGLKQGDSLANHMREVLEQLGVDTKNPVNVPPAKDAATDGTPSEKDARIAAVRDARKLLREKKTAEAVAVVAPFAVTPRPSDALSALITSLEKQGQAIVTSARQQVQQPEQLAVGTVAMVRARRLYGKLSAVRTDLDAVQDVVSKTPEGDATIQQAEALDKGRALDEAGETTAALETYREVVAKFPKTQVAEMAAKRIQQLQRSDKK